MVTFCDFKELEEALMQTGIIRVAQPSFWDLRKPEPISESELVNAECDEIGFHEVTERGEPSYFFVYREDYKINQYGLPRAHTTYCSKLRELSITNYCKSNTKLVDVWERSNYGNSQPDRTQAELPLCGICFRESTTKNMDDFFRRGNADLEAILRGETEGEMYPLDYNGYPQFWEKLSFYLREKANWKCSNCDFEVKEHDHRFFLEVHHKNGKLNNEQSDLQVLCTKCHFDVDEHHRKRAREDYLISKKLKQYAARY
ncbi:MAG: HNH endonuclease signature motif containing protein [Bacteroidota bacterium]